MWKVGDAAGQRPKTAGQHNSLESLVLETDALLKKMLQIDKSKLDVFGSKNIYTTQKLKRCMRTA